MPQPAFLKRYNSLEGFPSTLREVGKYPLIVVFEPGTLALIANALTNFAEMTDNLLAGPNENEKQIGDRY